MYLFLDTETIGLPISWNAPTSHFNNYPRMVQLAYQLCDEKGRVLEVRSFVIKPNGFDIPESASAIHGITTERATNEGVAIEYVLNYFCLAMKKAEFLIAHNMGFDAKVLGAELYRLYGKDPLNNIRQRCTMTQPSVVNFCKLPNSYPRGYKYPKLAELHTVLFGADFEGAHDASIDVEICKKCFFELLNRKIITT